MPRLLLFALAFGLAAPAAAQTDDADDGLVRVRLFGGRTGSEVRFDALDAPMELRIDGASVAHIPAGENVHTEREGSTIEVAAEDLRTSGDRVEIASQGLVRIRTGRTERTYRGSFVVTRTGRTLRVVNAVPMQPYVASVVATEYPFKEIEGVKAQAILVRTYALRHRGDRAGYDVEDDQRSQVYRGEGVVTDVTRRAAEETAGMVLTHRGRPIDALYSSSSGGYTAANEAVWFTDPVPYLRAVADPYDSAAPDHRWSTSASADRVHRSLASRHGVPVDGFEITRHSRSGRVVRARLSPSGKTINGAQLRVAINAAAGGRTLKSSKFTARRRGASYHFQGGGFGHGVGMSQYGAYGQARAGRSHREILDHYFAGTTLELLPGATPSAPVATAPPSSRWPRPRARRVLSDRVEAMLRNQAETVAQERNRPEPRAAARRAADTSAAPPAIPPPTPAPDDEETDVTDPDRPTASAGSRHPAPRVAYSRPQAPVRTRPAPASARRGAW